MRKEPMAANEISSLEPDEILPQCIEVDGYRLTIQDVVMAARTGGPTTYTFTDEARQRVQASYHLKQKILETEQPIYGVTTGFGDSCKRQISARKAKDLQVNLIRFLLCGTGPIASQEVTRATILIRANCLARGNSAVRPELITHLTYCLEHDILPLIPERGSVGASGDLVPLAYLAAMLVGEGKVSVGGAIREVREVFAEHLLEPLVLEAKEGLALINGTSFMSGFACLALHDAEGLAWLADLCTALACEALGGNKDHFAPFLHAQKPHPGQIESAAHIAQLLAESRLALSGSQILHANDALVGHSYQELKRPVQDKYSIRCAPQVTGVLYDTLTWLKTWVETEINSSNDNPLFDVESQSVHNGGNFYGGHIVQGMDALKVTVANIADLLDRQLELVVDEKFNNGLTPNLIPRFAEDDEEAGLHHGFKGMQIACSALTAEALKLSTPASIFSRSTEAHNQDKVSMGLMAARDATAIIELVQQVVAIHLLALCQALDLRGTAAMSPLTTATYRLIRSRVPFSNGDHRMDHDIKQVVELIRASALQEAVAAVVKP
jgi:phenylalanine ammonia-lyase